MGPVYISIHTLAMTLYSIVWPCGQSYTVLGSEVTSNSGHTGSRQRSPVPQQESNVRIYLSGTAWVQGFTDETLIDD